jgi:hypothetical protein
MLMLLITAGTQAVNMEKELEEQGAILAESGALLQMISRDFSSAFLSESLYIDIPHSNCQKNIFFLTRLPSDSLVAVGYFLDPSKKGHCYRFFANPTETLETRNQGSLMSLYHSAAPAEAHSELVATHLLSWEMTPIWTNKGEVIATPCITRGERATPPFLLEINMTFGTTRPHYFFSTVVALPSSR